MSLGFEASGAAIRKPLIRSPWEALHEVFAKRRSRAHLLSRGGNGSHDPPRVRRWYSVSDSEENLAARSHEVSYVLEKLRSAVDDLATSDSPLRDRIHNVFVSHLHVCGAGDFPAELRGVWESIETMLTAAGDLDGRGSVRNTLDGMDSEQVRSVAGKIVSLRNELQLHVDENRWGS